mgnify:CR=1
MKIDIIVCYPTSCDFPLWRQFIHDERSRFNKVIISFTETNQRPNLKDQIQKLMIQDDCILITNRQLKGDDDWRNVGINQGLEYCNGDWVWFTEQDFMIKNIVFWEYVEKYHHDYVAFGVKQGDRIHPCCLFIQKKYLNSLNKDFSANPPRYDHFGAIQEQIDKTNPFPQMPDDTYLHLNGLSSNWQLVQSGQEPNYRPEQFRLWLAQNLKVNVPLIPSWKETAREYLEKFT